MANALFLTFIVFAFSLCLFLLFLRSVCCAFSAFKCSEYEGAGLYSVRPMVMKHVNFRLLFASCSLKRLEFSRDFNFSQIQFNERS